MIKRASVVSILRVIEAKMEDRNKTIPLIEIFADRWIEIFADRWNKIGEDEKFTSDGYKIIGNTSEKETKGICCGKCGMKFDHGKAYGYVCNRSDCPIPPKIIL